MAEQGTVGVQDVIRRLSAVRTTPLTVPDVLRALAPLHAEFAEAHRKRVENTPVAVRGLQPQGLVPRPEEESLRRLRFVPYAETPQAVKVPVENAAWGRAVRAPLALNAIRDVVPPAASSSGSQRGFLASLLTRRDAVESAGAAKPRESAGVEKLRKFAGALLQPPFQDPFLLWSAFFPPSDVYAQRIAGMTAEAFCSKGYDVARWVTYTLPFHVERPILALDATIPQGQEGPMRSKLGMDNLEVVLAVALEHNAPLKVLGAPPSWFSGQAEDVAPDAVFAYLVNVERARVPDEIDESRLRQMFLSRVSGRAPRYRL